MQELRFEPRKSHASAHTRNHDGFRATQERKSSDPGDGVDGPREGHVEEAAQVTGSSSWLVGANSPLRKGEGRRSRSGEKAMGSLKCLGYSKERC